MHSTFQLQVGRQGAWERHHLVFAELPAAETSRELFRIMKTTIVRVTLLGWNLRSQAGAWERVEPCKLNTDSAAGENPLNSRILKIKIVIPANAGIYLKAILF